MSPLPPQSGIADLRVERRHAQVFMIQHRLDHADNRAALRQVRRARMPEPMLVAAGHVRRDDRCVFEIRRDDETRQDSPSGRTHHP